MDLIEILVLLAFIFFPLLQAVLEKLGKGGKESLPSPPEGEESGEHAQVGAPDPSRAGDVSPGAQESWSTGWGSWPGLEGTTVDVETAEREEALDALEALTAEEVVTEDQADELVGYQERLAAREMPEAARVSVPVVSMEPLRVDRRAEHRRFHEQVSTAPALPRRSRPAPLRRALLEPAELKRAVLLNEILGPPRSLSDLHTP